PGPCRRAPRGQLPRQPPLRPGPAGGRTGSAPAVSDRRTSHHPEPPALEEPPMSAVPSDRNLLFGILALQVNFLTRDALILGMNAWVLEKHRPLGEILVEQGALRTDLHEMLEA